MQRVICLAGPTGSGKTALAIEIAQRIGAEIINADSRQVYADFPILTAQPDAEERAAVPHHLYGFLPCGAKINAAAWAELALEKARQISEGGKTPILVGGTGFYFQALLRGLSAIPPIPPEIRAHVAQFIADLGSEKAHAHLAGIDPDYAAKIHPRDRLRAGRALEVWRATGKTLTWWHEKHRPKPLCQGPLLVVDMTLAELEPRLDRRIDMMLAAGAREEAVKARQNCPDAAAPGWSAIGCAEMLAWLDHRLDFGQCRAQWLANTRAYAKRQLTWFRGRGEAVWIRPGNADLFLREI